jgi:hypothetical protein
MRFILLSLVMFGMFFSIGCDEPDPPYNDTVVIAAQLPDDGKAGGQSIFFVSEKSVIRWDPEVGNADTRSLLSTLKPGETYLLVCDAKPYVWRNSVYSDKWMYSARYVLTANNEAVTLNVHPPQLE